MFYLKEFFLVLFETKFRGILFLILSIALSFSLFNRDFIKTRVAGIGASGEVYLKALLPHDNDLEIINSKLKKLPGVSSVALSDVDLLPSSLNAMGIDFTDGILESVLDKQYKIIKINFDQGLSLKNQALIKEYLKKLLGHKDVTISEIKKTNALKENSSGFLFKISKYFDFYFIGIFSFLWAIATFSIMSELKTRSYLIEKFQRKKDVSVKVFLTGLLSIFIPTILLTTYFSSFSLREFSYLVLLSLLPLLMLRSKSKVRGFYEI